MNSPNDPNSYVVVVRRNEDLGIDEYLERPEEPEEGETEDTIPG